MQRFAIGDVVRVKSDQVLGTVVCVSGYSGGSVVHIHTDGRGSRALHPSALERVARGTEPLTKGRVVATLLAVAGLAAAVLLGLQVCSLGAGSVITAFICFSVAGTVSPFLINFLNRSRPVRI